MDIRISSDFHRLGGAWFKGASCIAPIAFFRQTFQGLLMLLTGGWMDGWVDGWMDRTSDMNSASRLPIGPCPGRPFRTTARVASVARVACLARSNVCIELRPAGPIAQRRARLAGLGLSDPQGLQGGQGRGEGQEKEEKEESRPQYPQSIRVHFRLNDVFGTCRSQLDATVCWNMLDYSDIR